MSLADRTRRSVGGLVCCLAPLLDLSQSQRITMLRRRSASNLRAEQHGHSVWTSWALADGCQGRSRAV